MCYSKTNNKISDSLGVWLKTHPLFWAKKMESDKEKPKKEINLLLSCVRWNWILTKNNAFKRMHSCTSPSVRVIVELTVMKAARQPFSITCYRTMIVLITCTYLKLKWLHISWHVAYWRCQETYNSQTYAQTHTHRLLHVHNGRGVKLRFLRCSLSSLWSGIDALFLLTSSPNSERIRQLLVSWQHRLKTKHEFESQSSTQLWCSCATKYNETRGVCVKARCSTQPLCVCGGFQLCSLRVHPSVLRCNLSSCVSFLAPSGFLSTVTPSSIDFIGWFVFINAEQY